jgi:hypothetical protein
LRLGLLMETPQELRPEVIGVPELVREKVGRHPGRNVHVLVRDFDDTGLVVVRCEVAASASMVASG